jgi:hypothetical protein
MVVLPDALGFEFASLVSNGRVVDRDAPRIGGISSSDAL